MYIDRTPILQPQVTGNEVIRLVKSSKLRCTEKAIALHMAHDFDRTENRFWYSRPTLSRVAGVDGSTVHRAMQRLIEKGVLALVGCYDFGRYLRIIYCLNIPVLRELAGENHAPKSPKCVGVRFDQKQLPPVGAPTPCFTGKNAQNAHLLKGETATPDFIADGGDWEHSFDLSF